MYIHEQLRERAASARPVRVGLIGAGKFGSMFLAQAPSTGGLEVSVIADLDPDRARAACRAVGWSDALLARTRFTDDALDATGAADVDVVVEATGDPAAGIAHARAAFAAGKHIVMVNVEADVLAGPLLAAEARDAGVVYTMAYGDQPALTCEMVEWARVSGFEVVAGGQGHEVPAFVPRLDARHGMGALRTHREPGAGRGHEQPDVQLVPRRDQVRDRDGGDRQRHRTHPAAGRTPVPALRPRRPRARAPPGGGRRPAPPPGPGRGGVVDRARRAPGPERPALGGVRRHRGAQRLQRGLLPPVRDEHRRDRPVLGDVQAVPPHRAGAQRVDPVRRPARPADGRGRGTSPAMRSRPRSGTWRRARPSTERAASPSTAGSGRRARRSSAARCPSASPTG